MDAHFVSLLPLNCAQAAAGGAGDHSPVLLETFCESPRFRGTCYRAANWIHVGRTQGRGKLDVRKEYALPVKDIFLKPLQPDWRSVLCS